MWPDSMFKLIVISGLFSVCLADNSKWNGFKVRWDFLFYKGYINQPKTVDAAIKANFTKISDCDVTAPWRGARYVKKGDPAVTLLFDVNGYIAGIQAGIPKTQANGFPKASLRPPFIDDGTNYVITAYFTDPSIICTTGNPAKSSNTIGTGLYIQNSTIPEHSILLPYDERQIKGTMWTEGQCFPSMGKHYWYNLKVNMSCDSIFPFFLLYNRGKLNGFGWAFTTGLTSPFYEHPKYSYLKLFIKEPPTCLATVGILSTLHVFLTDNVLWNWC